MVEMKEAALSDAEDLKRIIKLCESFDFPSAIFNRSLECVYSKGGIIKPNTKADQYLNPDDTFADGDFTSTIFMIKGVQYCAKIVKTGEFYVCGLFNSHKLGEMARNTDFFNRLVPIIDVAQYNLVHLWEIMTLLKDAGNSKIAADMEEYLVRTNLICQNFFEYINMILKKPDYIRVDCYQMLERMVYRCNTFLAKCGRHIDFVGDFDKCFIRADQRHAFCAFISAIQNSLLYSPKDCVPLVTLHHCVIDQKEYVVLKIVNDNSYYAEEQKKLYENDFSKHKIGCGIPMIKRLVEETGGEFSLDEVNGKAVLIIKMPALNTFKSNMVICECDEYIYFDTGVPDFLEYKMREVIDLFKEEEFL
ncbi:MAG: hypothetical protein J1F03_01515 [Oscillospiraceae bacterium]|nr:hypothetical protein [Oscillospiraceae bacterium]